MKVVLGSKNQDKIRILENAFKKIHLKVKVAGIELDSGTTNQPLDKETTKTGAINRARNAKRKIPQADFWFGLEGGLHNYGNRYFLTAYSCLIDKKGNEYVGQGKKIKLPTDVSERIKNGEWFGKVIREYAKHHKIDQNLISRKTPLTQAIQNSYSQYLKFNK